MAVEQLTIPESFTQYDNLEFSIVEQRFQQQFAVAANSDSSLSINRSATSTPTYSTITQERISTCTVTAASDSERESIELPLRSSRNYRIINSDVSQKILQKLIAEQLAAVELAEKETKLLSKKRCGKKNVLSSFIQRQQTFSTRFWQQRNNESPKAELYRHHSEVIEASTEDENCKQISKRLLSDRNRISLPNNISTHNFENCTSSNRVDNDRYQIEDNSGFKNQKTMETLSGRLTYEANNIYQHQQQQHQQQQHHHHHLNEADTDAVQRLSFASSSTGYSSARSSLRSSEIGDDTSASHTLSTGGSQAAKRLLSREFSISEPRRSKLISTGSATQLDRIAMELLETERSYVNDLNDVIQGYLNFLIDHRDELEMTVDDISNTFGCIERLFIFNHHLYHQLDAVQLDVVQMAKIFTDNLEGFDDYVTYCTNYQKMVDTLAVLLKNGAIAEVLRVRQLFLAHSLPLSAYLLKPVQRVLKYHLFMENILKNSQEAKMLSDDDRSIIRRAFDSMTAQAEKINEEKKRAEHSERVRELQTALQKWCNDDQRNENLSKYGDLLLEGVFKLTGTKTNRQLFLFEEMLLIVKERNSSLICKDYIMCSSLMLNESVSADSLAFQVLSYDNPKIQYIFLASSMDQKRRWMKELKRMMLDHYTVEIPEKTKKLMLNMDDGTSKQIHRFSNSDFASPNSKAVKKVPKYLEKRRKSIDANQLSRRSQKKRSDSAGRRLLKASSTGNLTKELDIFSETALFPSKAQTCYCTAKDTVNKPSTSFDSTSQSVKGTKKCSSETGTGLQSLLMKVKRNSGNDGSRMKQTHRNDQSMNSNFNDHQCGTNICDCNPKQSECSSTISKRAKPNDSQILPESMIEFRPKSRSQSSCFENSVINLYNELQFLMTNAANMGQISDKKRTKDSRTNVDCQQNAMQMLNALVNDAHSPGKKNDKNCLSLRSRDFSYSLSKLDDVISEEYYCKSSKPKNGPKLGKTISNIIERSPDRFTKKQTDSDYDAFVNGSAFGRTCDSGMREAASGSEDGDSSLNIFSCSPSANDNEKLSLSSLTTHNIYHRRHSSQVAEQVWRLRMKKKLDSLESGNSINDKISVLSEKECQTVPSTSDTMMQIKKTDIIFPFSSKITADTSTIRHRSTGAMIARQRTPLTIEQCAELNDILDPNLGVVKNMIKQIEKSPINITAYRPTI